MRRDELTIEQLPAAGDQSRHEVSERDFRCVARAADHRFAEKGAAERYAIESTDQRAVQPAFDAVRVAEPEQALVTRADHRVDPGRRPVSGGFGTECHHVREHRVGGDAETIGDDHFPEAARKMKTVERQDRAQPRFDPMNRRIVRPVGHRKKTLRIGAEQQRRVDRFLMPRQDAGFTNFSVMRSDSPIATYLARSLSPSRRFGGRVQTPFG